MLLRFVVTHNDCCIFKIQYFLSLDDKVKIIGIVIHIKFRE